jgi:hypothetical protein
MNRVHIPPLVLTLLLLLLQYPIGKAESGVDELKRIHFPKACLESTYFQPFITSAYFNLQIGTRMTEEQCEDLSLNDHELESMNINGSQYHYILLFSNVEQRYLLPQVIGIQRALMDLDMPTSCLRLYLGNDMAGRSERIRSIFSKALDVHVGAIPSTVMRLVPPAPYRFVVLVDSDNVVRYQSSTLSPHALKEILYSPE